MATATVFHTDNTTEILDSIGDKFRLEELQKAVGGYIELVPLRGGDYLVVDEDGLSKQLPHNNNASAFARRGIVGTALVIRSDDID